MDAAARPPPVAGWNVEWSKRLSRYYYFNPVTKESKWERPHAAPVAAPAPAPAPVPAPSAPSLPSASLLDVSPPEREAAIDPSSTPAAVFLQRLCTRIEALLASEEETEIRLTPPVEKALRDIAMDEAYDSNLLAVEVGEWDDRTVVIYKAGFPPAEMLERDAKEAELEKLAKEDQMRTYERLQLEKQRLPTKAQARAIAEAQAAAAKEKAIEVVAKFPIKDKRTIEEVQADLKQKRLRAAEDDC